MWVICLKRGISITTSTKELIQWANNAQAKRESTWIKEERKYSQTIDEAIASTKPEEASEADEYIVQILNAVAWNEVQLLGKMAGCVVYTSAYIVEK